MSLSVWSIHLVRLPWLIQTMSYSKYYTFKSSATYIGFFLWQLVKHHTRMNNWRCTCKQMKFMWTVNTGTGKQKTSEVTFTCILCSLRWQNWPCQCLGREVLFVCTDVIQFKIPHSLKKKLTDFEATGKSQSQSQKDLNYMDNNV